MRLDFTKRRKFAARMVAATLGALSVWMPLVPSARAVPPPPPGYQQPPPPPPPGYQQPPPPPPPGYQQPPPPPPPGYQQPPPPPPGYQQPPPQPPPGYQQPPPPPPGQPGQPPYPYPYPYAQPGQPYPPPYGYPPGAYGPPMQRQPDVLPYDKGAPIPPGYKLEKRVRKGLVIPGAVLFGVFYLGSAIGGAKNIDADNAPYGALLVPVLGPFIVAGAGNFNSLPNSSNSGDVTAAFFVVDGLIQAAGVAMFLGGMLAKKSVLVRQDIATAPQPEFFVGPGSVGMKLRF